MHSETIEKRMQNRTGRAGLLAVVAGAGCVLSTGWAHAQITDPLFAGVDQFSKNSTSTTDVNLDKNALELAGMGKKDDGMAKKMDFVSVHTFEYPKEGDYNMAEVARIRARLDAGGWQHIVHETGANESTDVCVKSDDGGESNELVVITAEPKELTFVHLKGHMKLSDLSKFSGASKGGGAPDPTLEHRDH